MDNIFRKNIQLGTEHKLSAEEIGLYGVLHSSSELPLLHMLLSI